MYKVYVHTNKITGKKYVGITKLDPKVRWQNGHGYSHQDKFYPDILKYGWDNFEHEIMFDGLTKQEAHVKEAELIKLYDSVKNGYNSNCAIFDDEGNPIYCNYEYKTRAENNGDMKSYYQCKLKGLRLVHCIETGESYSTATEASKATGVDCSSISKVCRGERKSAGKHPDTGEPLHWKFLDKN